MHVCRHQAHIICNFAFCFEIYDKIGFPGRMQWKSLLSNAEHELSVDVPPFLDFRSSIRGQDGSIVYEAVRYPMARFSVFSISSQVTRKRTFRLPCSLTMGVDAPAGLQFALADIGSVHCIIGYNGLLCCATKRA